MATVVANVAGFLALVAPGLIYDMLWRSQRPAALESAFRESGRVALLSVLCHGAASLLLIAAQAVSGWRILPDIPSWILEPPAYVAREWPVVLRFAFLQPSAAIVLAVLSYLALYGGRRGPIEPYSIWYRVFLAERPPQSRPYVSIRIDDDSVVTGYLATYTSDEGVPAGAISLEEPLSVHYRGEPEPKPVLVDWRRLIVPYSRIRSVFVTYVEDEARSAT